MRELFVRDRIRIYMIPIIKYINGVVIRHCVHFFSLGGNVRIRKVSLSGKKEKN